jgi:YVTN family beta-propeller protein
MRKRGSPDPARERLVRCALGSFLALATSCGAAPRRAPSESHLEPSSAPRSASTRPAERPARSHPSGSITLTAREDVALAVDPDNHHVVALDPLDGAIRFTLDAGIEPIAVLALRDGSIAVIDRAGGHVLLYGATHGDDPPPLDATIAVAPDPVALAASRDERTLYVTSGASNTLTAIDRSTRHASWTLALAREPRNVAVKPDDRTLYIGHAVGHAVSAVDVATRTVRTLALPLSEIRPRPTDVIMGVDRRTPFADSIALARAVALSPNGRQLFVAHMVENTGAEIPRPRPVSVYGGGAAHFPGRIAIAALDLRTEQWVETSAAENANCVLTDPTSIAVSDDGMYAAVTAQGTAILGVFALHYDGTPSPLINDALDECDGANGVAFLRDGHVLVHCSFSHSVVMLAPGGGREQRAISLGEETLPPDVARGRRAFYRADDPSVSAIGLSCATCHPDGRDDGNTWLIGGTKRQTPFLAGRLDGTAPFNWIGENRTLEANVAQTITRIGGRGASQQTRADLVAYLRHGLRPPERAAPIDDGATIARGHQLFGRAGCGDCHVASHAFADGRRHDVSSARPGDAIRAFDTPSLRYVGLSAPYYHDGRFATLDDMIGSLGTQMGDVSRFTRDDRAALVAYLRTL